MPLSESMKPIVLFDFDGTITQDDTNVKLLEAFGNEANRAIEKAFISGKKSSMQAMKEHFKHLELSEPLMKRFMLKTIRVDPSFKPFSEKLKSAGIPQAVVSGGFENVVRWLFEREHIEQDIPIYANRIHFNETVTLMFYHEHDSIDCAFGPCGNCKKTHIENYQSQGHTVVFIGDGLTDRCAAHQADILFAKDALADYCVQEGIEYYPFETFTDVDKQLKALGLFDTHQTKKEDKR